MSNETLREMNMCQPEDRIRDLARQLNELAAEQDVMARVLKRAAEAILRLQPADESKPEDRSDLMDALHKLAHAIRYKEPIDPPRYEVCLRAAAALARPHKDAHETEWGKAMIHTVEQLNSRIAELEQRLEACGKYRHEADERQADLEAQLAAALARPEAGDAERVNAEYYKARFQPLQPAASAPCDVCGGKGTIYFPKSDHTIDCKHCSGTGVDPAASAPETGQEPQS